MMRIAIAAFAACLAGPAVAQDYMTGGGLPNSVYQAPPPTHRWTGDQDLVWVEDDEGNDLALVVSGCTGSHFVGFGVVGRFGAEPDGHPNDPNSRWIRVFRGIDRITITPRDSAGRALATFTLIRTDHRFSTAVRERDVAALRSATSIEADLGRGRLHFSGRGSARLIDQLQCMGEW